MTIALTVLAASGLTLAWLGLTGPRPTPTRTGRLRHDLRSAGIGSIDPAGVIAASAGISVVILVAVTGATGSAVVGSSLALPGAWGPLVWVRSRARSRRNQKREAWPDVIAMLVSAVRSGTSLPEAVASLALRGPRELAPAFASFADSYRASGTFKPSLKRLQDELSDPTADRICVALHLAHDVGGPELVRVLRALGNLVREDLKVRREIEARWSWTTSAARVAAAAPWLVLLMMALRPEAAAAYGSGTGILVIAGGAGSTLLGYRLMLRAGTLPDDERLVS